MSELNTEKERIVAVVCPKQKLVKIFERRGKKGKAQLLKTYRFKEDIPKVQRAVQVEHYDWGEWCVSERSSIEVRMVNVYDEDIINSIAERTLKIYNDYINPKP